MTNHNSTRLLLSGLMAAAIVGGVSGCQSSGGAMEAISKAGGGGGMADSIQKLAGDWVLSKMQGVDVASMLPKGAKLPDLNFGTDGKVSGFSGVNRLSGGFDVNKLAEGKLGLGNLATTKMAGPPEAMKVESKFTDLLSKVDGFKFLDSGKGLSLTQGGSSLLDFVKGK